MITEYEGFVLGQIVEQRDSWGNWEAGIITGIDPDDPDTEFFKVCDVNSTDNRPNYRRVRDIREHPEHKRAPQADAVPAAQLNLQYRLDTAYGPTSLRNLGHWQNIEVKASSLAETAITIAPSAHYQRFNLRLTLPHTDEEILAELRKLQPSGLSQHAKDILAGKF